MIFTLGVGLLVGEVRQRGWPSFSIPDGAVASWAQAIGSLAAVFVAVWIFRATKVEEARARLRDQAELLGACASAAYDAHLAIVGHADKLDEHLRGIHVFPQVGVGRLESIDQNLLALVQKPMPGTAISLLIKIRKELAYALDDLRLFNSVINPAEQASKEAIRSARARQKVVLSAASELRSLTENVHEHLERAGRGPGRG